MKPLKIKATYGGEKDFQKRIPELRPLRDKKAVVVGLGSIGAPIALELARAGIGRIDVVDYDAVDAGNACRWPFGMSALGQSKAEYISNWLNRDYPWTEASRFSHKLGGVHVDGVRPPGTVSDFDILEKTCDGANLIVDAAAEVGVQHLLSDWAMRCRLPYIAVTGTQGGWGGDMVRIRPQRTDGCWVCYMTAVTEGSIPHAPAKPGQGPQPVGCGDPTFTGAGVDMLQIAVLGARLAISTLCEGNDDVYPPTDDDVHVITLRRPDGGFQMPHITSLPLARHPRCAACQREDAATFAVHN